MKKTSLFVVATALMGAQITVPAYAQHLAPAATTGIPGLGVGSINATNCTLSVSVNTGPNLGGAHNGHAAYADVTGVNSGMAPCSNYTVEARVWGNGDLSNVIVRQLGTPICASGATVYPGRVSYTNISGNTVNAVLAATTVGACTLTADVDVGPTAQAVP